VGGGPALGYSYPASIQAFPEESRRVALHFIEADNSEPDQEVPKNSRNVVKLEYASE